MFPDLFASFNAQQKHEYILKNFVLHKNYDVGTQRHKRDIDIIKENHRFLWEDDDIPQTWETRLAKKYYDKLLKEYCIADLSRYKENKIAMRWRTEQEVVTGKGHLQCGSRKCEVREGLRSWEVNFSYMEQKMKKNALVKLRLCAEHTAQLNYTSKKREVKRQKRTAAHRAKESKRKRKRIEDEASNKNRRYSRSDDEIEESHMEDKEHRCIKNTFESERSVEDNRNEVPVTYDEEDVWSKKPEIESETKTRESDFERYLEDLLL